MILYKVNKDYIVKYTPTHRLILCSGSTLRDPNLYLYDLGGTNITQSNHTFLEKSTSVAKILQGKLKKKKVTRKLSLFRNYVDSD